MRSLAAASILLSAVVLAPIVAGAQEYPGKLTYASTGTGGSLHLAGELFALAAGFQTAHIPYKGALPAISDVIGGHVDSMFVAAPVAMPQIKAGRVRALGVASPRRAPSLPDVATFAEGGYSNVEVDSRYGLVVPAATPREIIAKLNTAIAKALSAPDLRERYVASESGGGFRRAPGILRLPA